MPLPNGKEGGRFDSAQGGDAGESVFVVLPKESIRVNPSYSTLRGSCQACMALTGDLPSDNLLND